MQRDAVGTIQARFERYGDIYYTVSQGDPLFVSRHPDHFHEVLVTRAADFEKRGGDLDHVLGQGLLNANGEVWRSHRRLVQPAFRRERLDRYALTVVEAADVLARRWAQEPLRDIGRDMMNLTLHVVARSLFDHDPGSGTRHIARAMDVLQRSAYALDIFPSWLPTPEHVRSKRALADLDRRVSGLIEARRRAPGDDDLLSQLLDGGELTDRELRDELVTLFLGGYETTSLALTWTWYLLAENPQWFDRLVQEIDSVLGDRAPTASDLDALPVTTRVVDESLRMYPPAYAVARVAHRDTRIGDYEAPAGSEVVFWIYFAHRDARWFQDPDRFDPDRFLPQSGAVRHPYAYMPFGSGQRTCIGRHFALMEARLVLARLTQRFRLVKTRTGHPGLHPRITLAPRRPVRMRAVPRRR